MNTIVDYELWEETEGAIEWLRKYLQSHRIKSPNVDDLIEQIQSKDNKDSSTTNSNTIMYLRMFETGYEMMQESIASSKKQKTSSNRKK